MGPILLLGFVTFPAKLNTFGEEGLCSLVMVCEDSVPVVLPEVGAAVILPGRTLIMLPRGNALVLLFPGGITFVGGDGKDGPLVILNDVGLEQLVRSGSKLPVSVQCTHHVRVTPSDPSSSQQQEYDTDPVVPRLPTGEVHLMLFFFAADTSIGFQNELETNVKKYWRFITETKDGTHHFISLTEEGKHALHFLSADV
jgi:hypothetical protein